MLQKIEPIVIRGVLVGRIGLHDSGTQLWSKQQFIPITTLNLPQRFASGPPCSKLQKDEGNGAMLRAVKSKRWLRLVADSRRGGMSARYRSARSNHSEPTPCPRTIVSSTPSGGWMT